MNKCQQLMSASFLQRNVLFRHCRTALLSFYWSPTHSFFVSFCISSSFPLFFLFFPLFWTLVFQWRIYYSCDSLTIVWDGKQHLKGFMKGGMRKKKWRVLFFSYSKESNPLVTPNMRVGACLYSFVSVWNVSTVISSCWRVMHWTHHSLPLPARANACRFRV